MKPAGDLTRLEHGQKGNWKGRLVIMTLEDAIKHAEEVAKEKEEASKRWKECKDSQTIEWSKLYFDSVEEIIEKCDKYATEHRQLAEWLRELKAVQDIIKQHDSDSMPEDYWYIDKIRMEVLE